MRGNRLISRTAPLLMVLVLALVSVGHAAPKYKILHAFRGQPKDGTGAWGSLTMDPKGNLYGTTINGGVYNFGTAFELTPHSNGHWSETILYSFGDNNVGNMPTAGLTLDPSGNLYGMTTSGGTVFELSPGPGDWNVTVLHDGGGPAILLLDQAGNLYAPLGPGAYDEGDISELAKDDGWAENTLYSFCPKGYPCVDGASPFAGVTWGPDRTLYGTTEWGGSTGYGVVFQLTPQQDGTWTETLLHSFPAIEKDGQKLYDSVIVDRSGNLYGATYQGGSSTDCGVIFELSPQKSGKWKETILYNFPKLSQGCVANTMAFDAHGNLWGTAQSGGASGDGVVFELSPQKNGKWTYKVVHQFNWKDGALPGSAVIFDKPGNLYGTTVLGGPGSSVGVVFELTP